jgi:tripartite-type tricarboxylate transporter receptor subunit TctC
VKTEEDTVVKRSTTFGVVLAFLLAIIATTPTQGAESVEDFYKGKQLTVFIPTPPAGIYDTFGRLVGQYLPKHLPGQPTSITKNMGGASGLENANYMANVAAKDGTVIAVAHSSVATALLLSPNETKFNPVELSWLGNVSKDPFIAYSWHDSKVKSVNDLYSGTALVGGQAVGSAAIDLAIIERKLFGFKYQKIITGYTGPDTYMLAIERGEIDATMGQGLSDLKSRNPEWLKEKKANIFLQQALSNTPELNGIPVAIDLAKTDQDRQVLQLLLARNELRIPIYAPPSVPADRLAALRSALMQTVKDPGFLEAAKKASLPVDGILDGDGTTAAVKRIAQTPKEIPQVIEKIFQDFKDGK